VTRPTLSVNRLGASYGSGQVLFDIDFELRPGEVMGLLGRNGMGKTTLVKSIVGLMKRRDGRIAFGGRDITRWAADRIARLGIALVPEGRQIFPTLSVDEHLTAFAARRNAPAGAAAADPGWTPARVYALFPRLAERRSQLGAQLSGGEQQMLAIGRALVTNPHLLILDEATEGLAPLVREEIWRCLQRLREAGQTILVVDKYVNRLVDLADRHLILERGRIVWQGVSQALHADRTLWHRYLGL
jgi:branched-chain amino acid transport system ATP-binding protein